MKKILIALLLTLVSASSFAQFTKGTKYINASLTGFDLGGFSKRFTFGLDATGGYFLQDAWMLYGRVGASFDHIKGSGDDRRDVQVGLGARYYIHQNGLFLSAGLKYKYEYLASDNLTETNYFIINPEIGYCFYLNHYLSVEPSLYYDICLNNFSDGSKIGVRVGLGFYF